MKIIVSEATAEEDAKQLQEGVCVLIDKTTDIQCSRRTETVVLQDPSQMLDSDYMSMFVLRGYFTDDKNFVATFVKIGQCSN
jgi:hypothetical protein